MVFTHAWGLRSDEWNYQVPALAAAGLWCVLYDRRGHGRSDRPAGGYDIDTMADDLAAVIEHFDLEGVTLVAHSLGSKEVIRYLTRHGDSRVARVILVAPTTPLMRRTADNPDGIDPALIEANYQAVAADVPKWCADFEAARPYFGSSPGGSRGLVDWTTRMIVDTPLHVLLETYRLNANVDMRAELRKIQVPALIIHGDQDGSAPIGLTGRKTAELIPGASLTVYPGAGHGLYASDHDTLNADLLAFIGAAALLTALGKRADPDRQPLQAVHEEGPAPAQRVRVSERDVREPAQELPDCDLSLHPGQWRAHAVVNAVPEREVAAGLARDVEPPGIGEAAGVPVGREQ